jgi:sugar lactone lactonase YvrE
VARKIVTWALGLIGVVVLYLFLWPVPIDPGVWEVAPKPPYEGDFAANTLLQDMDLFATPDTHGPEDVAIATDGRIYVGVEEGKVLRYDPDGSNPIVFAKTGGRPLGLDFDVDGNLIVADAAKGLLSIDADGKVTVLCTESDGVPLGFTDDVDVDSENVAWFSDASVRWDHHHVMNEALESRPNGRLVKYDIGTGECTDVLGELYFANGIAVSPDETYVLVNETMRYRTKRVFVRGPRTGVVETFIDNLPGFPDGISTGSGGVFWLALYAPRNDLLDQSAASPWIRRLVYRLPEVLKPKPRRHPLVLGLDENGKVVRNLQDSEGLDFSKSTSAEQFGDSLYVGSLTEPKWGRFDLSTLE